MDIPVVGTRVRIVTDWSDKRMYRPWPKTHTTIGVIVPSNSWDKANTVKLLRDPEPGVFGTHRESVIGINRIISIDTIGKEDIPVEKPRGTVYEITGSKGDIYTVVNDDGKWSCNCQAGSRGIACRHIKEAQKSIK